MEAITLALIMGANPIYLLGMDMTMGKERYFYGNPAWAEKSPIDKHKESLNKRAAQFDAYAPYKDRIFNCSPISEIKVFRKLNIEDVLCGN